MTEPLKPLFIRLPRKQAAALDRLSTRTGRAKQHVVSELVAQALTALPSPLPLGRVEVSPAPDARADEVLTLDEAAALLRVSADLVRARAERGDFPGRRLGDEWRFSRLALLSWLAEGEAPASRGKR